MTIKLLKTQSSNHTDLFILLEEKLRLVTLVYKMLGTGKGHQRWSRILLVPIHEPHCPYYYN